MKHLTILFQILICHVVAIGQGYVLQTTNGGIRLADGAITQAKVQGLSDSLTSKQTALVSGTNIKTINGASVLGSGDLVVSGAASFGSITGQPSDNANLVTALNTRLAVAGNGSQLTGLTAGQVGLGNCDNTSDINKPLSTAATTALALKETIPVAGQGYGGTVVQQTNKTTGVTLNKLSGQITMSNAALTAGSEVAFSLNNNTITSTDIVIVNVQSVGTAGAYLVSVGAVANGSCSITVSNASAGSLSQALVLNFRVLKSVAN